MIDAVARARGRGVRDAVAGDRGEDIALDRVGVGHRPRLARGSSVARWRAMADRQTLERAIDGS